MGMTIAQYLIHRAKAAVDGRPLELRGRHFNPLETRLGGILTFEVPAVDGLFFVVRQINSYAERAGGRDHRHAEYVMAAMPADPHPDADADGVVHRRLWVYPAEDADRRLSFRMLLLAESWTGSFDEAAAAGLYHPDYDGTWETAPALQSPQGTFNDIADGVTTEYRRRFGDIAPHRVAVAALRDLDGDGRLQEDEVAALSWRYWDYERPVTGADNNARVAIEYMVAVETDDGWFTLYKGPQVSPEAVTKL